MTKTNGSASVAVVVPFYREDLRPTEELSLLHLETFLGSYERVFFSPESLQAHRAGFSVVHFADHYFRSVDDYSRLLLSPSFYRAFEAYEFILVYQLDALVFSDQLAEWCRAGYDFVGAPWLRDPERPERGFSRVGNGGFSLRRVAAFLDVLDERREESRSRTWLRLLRAPLPDLETLPRRQRWRKRARVLRAASRGVDWYRRHYALNEDHFWSDRARIFDPTFQIASVEAGLRFAFERAPRHAFERTRHQLPFGCHAWERWDPAFWEPHLLPLPSAGHDTR